ncbi:MAG TPA: hypothetical protein VI819_01545 [Patescibacteria group bacterium]|nr:hypothetical protein [Patescibacteria group bacterium]
MANVEKQRCAFSKNGDCLAESAKQYIKKIDETFLISGIDPVKSGVEPEILEKYEPVFRSLYYDTTVATGFKIRVYFCEGCDNFPSDGNDYFSKIKNSGEAPRDSK